MAASRRPAPVHACFSMNRAAAIALPLEPADAPAVPADVVEAVRAVMGLSQSDPMYAQQAQALLTTHGDAIVRALEVERSLAVTPACDRKRERLAVHGYQVSGYVLSAGPDAPCAVVDGEHVSWHIRPITPSAAGESIGEWGIWLDTLTNDDSEEIFRQHPEIKERLLAALRQAVAAPANLRAIPIEELAPVQLALAELQKALRTAQTSHPFSGLSQTEIGRLTVRVEDALAVLPGPTPR